jgi:hypothetical protein
LLACAKGNELIGIIAKQANDTIIALYKKWASTERQRFLSLQLVKSKGSAAMFTHNHNIGCNSTQTFLDNVATTS